MADAVCVHVAKEVVKYIELSRPVLSQTTFTLERSYADWDYELENTESVRIDVALMTTRQESELLTRGGLLGYTVPLDVAIRQKLTLGDTDGRVSVAMVDGLMLLVQEIHELFTETRIGGYLKACWKEDPKITAAPVIKHLREMKQFTGLLRLVFIADKQTRQTE